MTALDALPVDPWRLEILTVSGASRTSSERSAISRDVQRGLLLRACPGGYVDRPAFESLSPEQQHVVRMRALDAVAPGRVVFSHWSAAVALGLPVLRSRLDLLHVSVPEDDDRHRQGTATHHFLLEESEVGRIGGLFTTGPARTVVDVAGAGPFEEGVMAADAVLHHLPREVLEAAVDLAGPRRASRRIADTVDFADPGAESAAESRLRVSLMRLGIEVPELQRRVRLRDGSDAFLDAWLPIAHTGIEVDGEQKYLDAAMAVQGPARAVIAEKRREDEVRLGLRALVRIGWVQTGDPVAMRSVLARVGVRPTRPRTPFESYCERARRSVPRHRRTA